MEHSFNQRLNEREIFLIREELREMKKKQEELEKRMYELEKNDGLDKIGIKNNLDMIIANTKDIDEMKDKPNKRQESIIAVVITGIITAIITYITSKL